jgi:hypothetical protein
MRLGELLTFLMRRRKVYDDFSTEMDMRLIFIAVICLCTCADKPNGGGPPDSAAPAPLENKQHSPDTQPSHVYVHHEKATSLSELLSCGRGSVICEPDDRQHYPVAAVGELERKATRSLSLAEIKAQIRLFPPPKYYLQRAKLGDSILFVPVDDPHVPSFPLQLQACTLSLRCCDLSKEASRYFFGVGAFVRSEEPAPEVSRDLDTAAEKAIASCQWRPLFEATSALSAPR